MTKRNHTIIASVDNQNRAIDPLHLLQVVELVSEQQRPAGHYAIGAGKRTLKDKSRNFLPARQLYGGSTANGAAVNDEFFRRNLPLRAKIGETCWKSGIDLRLRGLAVACPVSWIFHSKN